ncbi:MAG: hypothetical protein KC438_05805 [Thermomicrobiales bacterium]|nr:hypothetical protein [Thermomicrobiales bacterium]MCO5221491.1 hypothetical protein [Thermomicrobiales bacterium]
MSIGNCSARRMRRWRFFSVGLWMAQLLYAASFTQNATPIWTNDTPQSPGIRSARVVSPDSTAAWEYVAGTLTGIALSVEQAVGLPKDASEPRAAQSNDPPSGI